MRFRMFEKFHTRLDIHSEIKIYIPQMNSKMTTFKYIVQSCKCNSVCIEDNGENSIHFMNEKIVIIWMIWTRFQRCIVKMKSSFNKKIQVHLLVSNGFGEET